MFKNNKKSHKGFDTIVGYFFTIATMIFIILIFILVFRTKWSFLKCKYTAYYEYGNDINPGTLVTLNGINIGEVKSIDIDENNRVKVIFTVSRRYKKKIRKDSIAKIIRPLLIGNKQIMISPGSPNVGILPPGSEIMSEESSELIDLVSGLSIQNFLDNLGLNPKTENNDYQKITVREIYDQAISSLVILNEFQKSLKLLGDSMTGLDEGMKNMGTGFNNMGYAMKGMNQGMKDISTGFYDMNKNLNQFGPVMNKLIPLIDELEVLIKAMEMNPMFKKEVSKIKQNQKKTTNK